MNKKEAVVIAYEMKRQVELLSVGCGPLDGFGYVTKNIINVSQKIRDEFLDMEFSSEEIEVLKFIGVDCQDLIENL